MRVFKVRGRHLVALVLVVLALLALAMADGYWWRAVIAGVPLPFSQVALAELPPPLLEEYDRSRWAEGVDAWLGPGGESLYVLLRWGQKPTGGYRVVPLEARLVRRFGRAVIRVRAEYVTPEPGQPVIEVASFPGAGMRLLVRGYTVTGCTVVAVDQLGRGHGTTGPVLPQGGREQN